AATASLAEIAEELVRAALADHPQEKHISLVAISVSHLEQHPKLHVQSSLGARHEERGAGTRRGLARHAADRAVDRIRDRFGWEAIAYGSGAVRPFPAVSARFRPRA